MSRHHNIEISHKRATVGDVSGPLTRNGLHGAHTAVQGWQLQLVVPVMALHDQRRDHVAVLFVRKPGWYEWLHTPRFGGLVGCRGQPTIDNANDRHGREAG